MRDDPIDAKVQTWFATGDISLRVQNWNGMDIAGKGWTEDPVFSWWYTAGIVSIAASLPQGGPIAEYLGHYADDLRTHASAAPDDSPKWVPAAGDPVAALAAVQGSLQGVFPVAPYPDAGFAGGAAGYAQLGVYTSTLQELVDSPAALSRPESRAFASVVLGRLEELHTTFADGLSAASLLRAVNEPILLDRQWIDKTWRQPLSRQLNTKWPDGPRKADVLGLLVTQVAYNAAVLKDLAADANFRAVIKSLPVWQGIDAKTRADLATLQKVPEVAKTGTWHAVNTAATAVVLDIVNAK